MSRLIISLGEQNFPALEDLNNARITNYVFFLSSIHIQMQKSLYRGKIEIKHLKLPLSRNCDGKKYALV